MAHHQHIEAAAVELAQPPQMRQEILRDHEMGVQMGELARVTPRQRLVMAREQVLQDAALFRGAAQFERPAQGDERSRGLLARDVLRYRRQLLALREFFAEQGCTVLLMQEMTRGTPGDIQAEALVHGYLTMHQESPEYGGQRRRLRVHKMRGMRFRDGFHDFSIQTGGRS